jgi:ribose transport system permease protein
VVKFNETGGIVEAMGGSSGSASDGHLDASTRILFVGGILNNRIGCHRISGADPTGQARLLLGTKP